jgi:hypothetical protein
MEARARACREATNFRKSPSNQSGGFKEMKRTKILIPMLLATMGCAAGSVFAQEPAVEGPVPTTALITLEVKKGVTPDPSMLKLQVDRHDSPITAVTPVTPAAAQVAILIDDGVRTSFGSQMDEFKQFILGLPQGTKVLVGYMQNGTVRSEGGFSTDREAVASQLHITTSIPGIDASPYFCLSEFVKHWPSNDPGARFVLMITNGVDPYNGRPSITNQDSPNVEAAQNDAQRAGVAVYSIYYGGAGIRGGSFSGQSYLEQVAEATGGMSFYQGTITPPSLAPYLDRFTKAIAESYSLRFMVSNTKEKRGSLTQIKVTSSQPGVKVHAPQSVHPGLVEE